MDEIENLTIEYQKANNRLQALALQKAQLSAEKEEYKKALEEVEKTQGKVYTTKGNILIEVSKEESIKAIKDEQDSIDLKLSIIEKQYSETEKRNKELLEKINSLIKKDQ
ncbi:MAG: prefoldin subunit [Candidatus Micrarchaeaceae archaeon]